jgi:threonine synthase
MTGLRCIACGSAHPGSAAAAGACACGGLLEAARGEGWLSGVKTQLFDARLGARDSLDRSGVWRFREGILPGVPAGEIVTHPEGGTSLYRRGALSAWAGVEDLAFKHEGENPTASFKDRGMTVAITQAVRAGARTVACASTGNTSASLAAYAAQAGLKAVVFVPAGKISAGKMAQTLGYGAKCLAIRGDFDAAMQLVQGAARELGIYLLNSINPYRIEGQKTIVWELLQDLNWRAPDWIALPAGNLGNTSAFGKALREAREAGWIAKVPRLAAIQASGANPFYLSFAEQFRTRHRVQAETIATAIRIGNPVSYERARASIEYTRGVVAQVSDAEILAAKSEIDRAGIGCEPASACSLAGTRALRTAGVIRAGESVVGILTGHILKDPDAILGALGGAADRVTEVDATLAAVARAL